MTAPPPPDHAAGPAVPPAYGHPAAAPPPYPPLYPPPFPPPFPPPYPPPVGPRPRRPRSRAAVVLWSCLAGFLVLCLAGYAFFLVRLHNGIADLPTERPGARADALAVESQRLQLGETLNVLLLDGGNARVTVLDATYHRGGCDRTLPPSQGNSLVVEVMIELHDGWADFGLGNFTLEQGTELISGEHLTSGLCKGTDLPLTGAAGPVARGSIHFDVAAPGGSVAFDNEVGRQAGAWDLS